MKIFNFKLDLQFFAQKKAGGSASTNRSHDSISKRRGIKKSNGQEVKIGMILYRQLGSKIRAGEGVKIARDYTLFAIKKGRVDYYKARGHTFVRIIDSELNN